MLLFLRMITVFQELFKTPDHFILYMPVPACMDMEATKSTLLDSAAHFPSAFASSSLHFYPASHHPLPSSSFSFSFHSIFSHLFIMTWAPDHLYHCRKHNLAMASNLPVPLNYPHLSSLGPGLSVAGCTVRLVGVV